MTGNRDDFVFFWGNQSPFSNWYKSPFTHDGIEYNCAEQMMMYKKARMFGDFETADKIMKTSNPRKQKELGRQVKNFDAREWNIYSTAHVTVGLIDKFAHDPLKKILLDTGNKTIVEASPFDNIWGIGLAEDHPDAPYPGKWLGENRLGKALMLARAHIRIIG